MTHKTVAVVGIGFAPSKSPELAQPMPAQQELAAPNPEIQARNAKKVGKISTGKTVAVVGIGFAPSKSK